MTKKRDTTPFRPSDRTYGEGSLFWPADRRTIYIIRPVTDGRSDAFELSVKHYGNDILLASECFSLNAAIRKASDDWLGK